MTCFNKELISAAITVFLIFAGLAVWSGNYLTIAKGLGTAIIVFGVVWFTWRGVFKLLDKAFPDKINKTYTVGSNKEAIKVDYTFGK